MKCYIFVSCLFWWCVVVKSAKILAIFPSPGYSQYFVAEPLLTHLAQRGHEITLMSFFKPKQPVNNITPIEISGLQTIDSKLPILLLTIM